MAPEHRVTRQTEGDRVRAGDNIRYHLRMGHLTRPEVCGKCGSTATAKPIPVPADWKRPLEDITWMCWLCHRAVVGRKTPVQLPRLQNVRKLPAYNELKRLVLPPRLGGVGLTYREVAERYGTTTVVVNTTLKNRAIRLGEWPLPIDRSAKIKRAANLRRQTVPGVGIIGLLDDYLAAHPHFFAVGSDGDCVPIKFTLKQWASWNGFPARYLSSVRTGNRPNIRRDKAAKLLHQLGEPVPRRLTRRV